MDNVRASLKTSQIKTMPDVYTEVIGSTGLAGNIKRRFGGMIIGLIIFALAFPLLWWNEGQLLRQHEGLNWVLENVIAVDPREAGNQTEGRPIHIVGIPKTSETLSDRLFGLSLDGLLRLHRQVEMYQWQETETTHTRDTPGGGSETIREYSYSKIWSEDAISSRKFAKDGYENPRMPYQSEWHDADEASLGVFRLEQNVIRQLNKTETLQLDDHIIAAPDGFRPVSNTRLYAGIGNDSSPVIGDLRVQFNYVAIQPISIIAQHYRSLLIGGNRLTDITTPDNLKFLLVGQGEQTARQLVTTRRNQEELKAWLIRAAGLVMMVIGVQSIFHFLGSLLGFIPFFRGFVGGVGLIAGLLIALTLGSTTIALAWLAVRPIYAYAFLGLAAVTLIGAAVSGARNVRQTRQKLSNA